MKIKKKGFSLVELIVVLSIIAILYAIVVPVYSNYKSAAKNNAVLASSIELIEVINLCYLNKEAITRSSIENKLQLREIKVNGVDNDDKNKATKVNFNFDTNKYTLNFSFKEGRWTIYNDEKEIIASS